MVLPLDEVSGLIPLHTLRPQRFRLLFYPTNIVCLFRCYSNARVGGWRRSRRPIRQASRQKVINHTGQQFSSVLPAVETVRFNPQTFVYKYYDQASFRLEEAGERKGEDGFPKTGN